MSGVDKDQRKGWLRELKVGDQVIKSGWYRTEVGVISKITPTGKIDVLNNIGNPIRFSADGYHRSGSGIGSTTRLEEASWPTISLIKKKEYIKDIEYILSKMQNVSKVEYDKRLELIRHSLLQEFVEKLKDWNNRVKEIEASKKD